jgi:lysocardiolipin and lysophospholipid acyltransferase
MGLGLQFFEFIFIERNLKQDEQIIVNALEHEKEYCKPFPLWLVVFPEGQLNVPENREKIDKYRQKAGILQDPQIVLLPKSTGLFMCTDGLKAELDCLYDVTVGYSGLDVLQIPYEEYSIDAMFFKDYYPQDIYIHVQKLSIAELPGIDYMEEQTDKFLDHRKFQFNLWLRDLFMEKDRFMIEFYKNGRMSADSIVYHPKATFAELLLLTVTLSSSFVTLPLLFSLLAQVVNIIF